MFINWLCVFRAVWPTGTHPVVKNLSIAIAFPRASRNRNPQIALEITCPILCQFEWNRNSPIYTDFGISIAIFAKNLSIGPDWWMHDKIGNFNRNRNAKLLPGSWLSDVSRHSLTITKPLATCQTLEAYWCLHALWQSAKKGKHFPSWSRARALIGFLPSSPRYRATTLDAAQSYHQRPTKRLAHPRVPPFKAA